MSTANQVADSIMSLAKASMVSTKELEDAMKSFNKLGYDQAQADVGRRLHTAIAGMRNFSYEDGEPWITSLRTEKGKNTWFVHVILNAHDSSLYSRIFSTKTVAKMMSRFLEGFTIGSSMVSVSGISVDPHYYTKADATIAIPASALHTATYHVGDIDEIDFKMMPDPSPNCRCVYNPITGEVNELPVVIPPNTDTMYMKPDGSLFKVGDIFVDNSTVPPTEMIITSVYPLTKVKVSSTANEFEEPDPGGDVEFNIPDIEATEFKTPKTVDFNKLKPNKKPSDLNAIRKMLEQRPELDWNLEPTKPKRKRRMSLTICWWILSAAATTGFGYGFKWLIENGGSLNWTIRF